MCGRLGTTICCSAVALTTVSLQPLASESNAIPLFPARQQWTLALNNALAGQPGFSGARGYFPIDGDRLVAYDLAAGRQLWMVESEALWPPVATDRQVFVALPDAIVARSADDGKESWRLPIADRLAVGPVADSRWLVAATVSGTVLAVRVEDGGIAWQGDAGARISAPPTLTPDRVYVPLEDRRVLALDAERRRRRLGAATGRGANRDPRSRRSNLRRLRRQLPVLPERRARRRGLALANRCGRHRHTRGGWRSALLRRARQHPAQPQSLRRIAEMEARAALAAARRTAGGRRHRRRRRARAVSPCLRHCRRALQRES